MFYNVNTAKSVVKIFNLCFFIGNTCIYSFLSVFLRHLGLSAFQVGLLRGLQAFTAVICIPIVVLCGRKCLQRRPPMMSCLFLTMAAYLSLLVISLPAPSCFHKNYPVCENYTGRLSRNTNESHLTTGSHSTMGKRISQRSSDSNGINETSRTKVTEPFFDSTNEDVSTIHDIAFTPPDNFGLMTLSVPENTKHITDDFTNEQNKFPGTLEETKQASHQVSSADGSNPVDPSSSSTSKTEAQKSSPYATQRKIYFQESSKYFYETTEHPIPANYANTKIVSQRAKRLSHADNVDVLQNLSSSNKRNGKVLLWPAVDISCIIILLLILLIAEVSASPVETIANDAWYTYLDEIDYLVAYTKKSISIPVSAAVTVFCIGCVTIVYCGFGPALNAYSLHIYLFGIFFGFALVITIFYPFPQEQKSFYRSLVSVRNCVQGREAYILFATATIAGVPQAAYTEFTLWFIEDIGGSEFVTSTAVAVALLFNAIPYILFKKMNNISSRSAMVAFGMFCCAAQFLIYVAIQVPWAIVSSQILQFGSSCIFWTTIKQRLIKVLQLKSEHSLALALKGFYLTGYAFGAVLDGMLYTYSPTLLFSTMTLLSLVWCLVLFFCEFCCLNNPGLSLAEDREEEMKLFDDMQDDSEDD